ncbi:hypothetical protein ACEN2T_17515 [Pseudomonas sp. W22_MBD1_FP4]|uniref:hypothetical protein n=1 Tax=Pseudomonas sp. W22_MBD1_FP4 TaxID=3240272 RepID=UPI003F98657F
MDVKELFAQQVKTQQASVKPRNFLVQVEADPAFSTAKPDVFRVRGIRTDTNERVYVIAVKSNAGQAVPKAGDVLRADKAVVTGKNGTANVPVFTAEFFHTYEKGFCINAVMQPLPVRVRSNMQDAAVLAYDPSAPASVLTGSQLQSDLVSKIVEHLMPWKSDVVSAITHDVSGKSLWENGPLGGMAPVAVVRYSSQSFKVYGLGGVKQDLEDKGAGYRFPTTQEITERVAAHPGVQNILAAIKGLTESHASPAQLDEIDVSVLPGISLSVGRDMILFNNKAKREYFSVPNAYEVKVEGREPFFGHKQSFIHLKHTRTGRVGVVDTAPAPGGKLTAGVPLFAAEVEREQHRANLAAGITAQQSQSVTPQSSPNQRPLSRREIAAVDDFGSAGAGTGGSNQDVTPQPPQSQQSAQSASDLDDDHYDYASFEDDLHAIESLSKDLPQDDLNEMFEQAEAISAARSTAPRLG